jgi:hypothetical protein
MHVTIKGRGHLKMTGETDTTVKGEDSANYDNYGSHSQVAAGYKDNNYQGDDRRNSGYHNYGREDSRNSKRFQSRGSREYNQSPDDMLNGPCHIHYAFIERKRVSIDTSQTYL